MKTQNPVIDFRLIWQDDQSESQKALNDKQSSFLNTNPLPGADFKYRNTLKATCICDT